MQLFANAQDGGGHFPNASIFADGLVDWIRDRDTPGAEAAGVLLADLLLWHRRWLASQFSK